MRERKTDRQTDRQRQLDRHTEKQAVRESWSKREKEGSFSDLFYIILKN